MIVTAVEPRKKALSALYIDGEFAMKLDTQTLAEYRISAGKEISDEELKELIDASDFRRAKERALWLLSYRDHTTGELLEKLKKDFPEAACEKAIARMQELSLIDDRRVAKKYAEELHRKHHSEKDIIFRLSAKGIDKEEARLIVEELSIDPVSEICALVEKKHLKNLNDEKGLRRTYASLQRGGFKYSDIKTALREFTDADLDQ